MMGKAGGQGTFLKAYKNFPRRTNNNTTIVIKHIDKIIVSHDTPIMIVEEDILNLFDMPMFSSISSRFLHVSYVKYLYNLSHKNYNCIMYYFKRFFSKCSLLSENENLQRVFSFHRSFSPYSLFFFTMLLCTMLLTIDFS